MHGGSTASWGKIGVLALCAFLIGADGFILAAILPQIADQLNVPLAQAGLLITAFAWVYAVSAPLFGMVLGRWNRRSTLGAAMLVFALGNVLVATAPTYGWMLAARVVSALGSSMATPTAMALATSLVPARHRGKAISVVSTGMTLATVVAVPLGALMGGRYGYRAVFWAMGGGAIAVLLAILASIRAREATASKSVPSIRALLMGLADRQTVLTLAVTITIFIAGYACISYLSAIVGQAGMGGQFSLVLLVFGLGSLLGGVLGGWLCDRWPSVVLVRAGMGVFAVSLAALGVAAASDRHPWAVHVCVAAWTVSAWVAVIAQQYRLIALAPERAQLNLSLNSSSIYIGQGFAGVLGAAVISAQPAHVIPLVASAVVVLALAMTAPYETMRGDEPTKG